MTTLPTEPRLATVAELPIIVDLVQNVTGFLHAKGTDQWANPWPSEQKRNARIEAGIRAKATWVLWDGTTAVATITSYPQGNEWLWTPEERSEPAAYLNRIVINRDYAGLRIGAGLIDWASRRAAAEYGARTVRVDVWTTNAGLHQYYKGIGFEFLRVASIWPEYPSNALFQRPVDATSGV